MRQWDNEVRSKEDRSRAHDTDHRGMAKRGTESKLDSFHLTSRRVMLRCGNAVFTNTRANDAVHVPGRLSSRSDGSSETSNFLNLLQDAKVREPGRDTREVKDLLTNPRANVDVYPVTAEDTEI